MLAKAVGSVIIVNPYQPAATISDAEAIAFFTGPLEWAGRRFQVTAEQLPLSLWLVARVTVRVDGDQELRFIKWRWHKRISWTFLHGGNLGTAMLHCSGANRILCRLTVDGFVVGDSVIPAKNFWLGMITVAIVTCVMLLAVMGVQRR